MAKVVILSGAGISAESGIDTFRDSGGLWDEYDVKEVAYKGALENNRAQTLEFYDKRRVELKDKEPNKAHKVVAGLKNKYKDKIAIITQNVDDLFEKAGLQKDNEVIHLHGFMKEVRCEKCNFTYDIGYEKIGLDRFDGKCPNCGSKKIRPNIVMFEEIAPNYELFTKELKDCELFIVIGTSGKVIDVSSIAKHIKTTILNNLEQSKDIDDSLFSKVLYKKTTEAIEEIKEDIENHLGEVKEQFHYQCKNCDAEYKFYKMLDQFECTICKEMVIKDNIY